MPRLPSRSSRPRPSSRTAEKPKDQAQLAASAADTAPAIVPAIRGNGPWQSSSAAGTASSTSARTSRRCSTCRSLLRPAISRSAPMFSRPAAATTTTKACIGRWFLCRPPHAKLALSASSAAPAAGVPPAEPVQVAAAAPGEALARLTVPTELKIRLGDALPPGSSLVVSDQGINQGETGEGTDFIVRLH